MPTYSRRRDGNQRPTLGEASLLSPPPSYLTQALGVGYLGLLGRGRSSPRAPRASWGANVGHPKYSDPPLPSACLHSYKEYLHHLCKVTKTLLPRAHRRSYNERFHHLCKVMRTLLPRAYLRSRQERFFPLGTSDTEGITLEGGASLPSSGTRPYRPHQPPHSLPPPPYTIYIIGARARGRDPGGCPVCYLEIGAVRGVEGRESVREERERGRGARRYKIPIYRYFVGTRYDISLRANYLGCSRTAPLHHM